MHNKFQKGPLLYIHQEKKDTPKAHMQKKYVASENLLERNDKTRSDPPANSKKTRSRRRSPSFQHSTLHDESVADTQTFAEEEEEREETSKNMQAPRDKKFKDMTLEEKVIHFANTPAISPRMRCKVQMSNRSLRGKIIDFADNIVYMQVGRRTSPMEISFDHIIDIQLLGF